MLNMLKGNLMRESRQKNKNRTKQKQKTKNKKQNKTKQHKTKQNKTKTKQNCISDRVVATKCKMRMLYRLSLWHSTENTCRRTFRSVTLHLQVM